MFRNLRHNLSLRPFQHRTIMKIVPIPVRKDNYAYLLIDESSKTAAAVDPYDVAKVAAVAKSNGVEIVAGITTHHHYDHAGGNKAFAAKYPGASIYGGSNKVLALSRLVKDKDEFKIGNIQVKCLATPCHTRDSICYYVTDSNNEDKPGSVFTGDTLFIAGCGRFFEGVGSEMVSALEYLGTLPDRTTVFVGHEYTKDNLAFARHIDPSNPELTELQGIVEKNHISTGHSTIGDEKKWNVFMRLDSAAVRNATSTSSHTPKSSVIETLRELKNSFNV